MYRTGLYRTEAGACPFAEWFAGLDAAYAAKVTVAIRRLESGHRAGLKNVGAGVAEWKIDWGPGVRIYLAFDGPNFIILLGGGSKTRQNHDIAAAIACWEDYKARKTRKE